MEFDAQPAPEPDADALLHEERSQLLARALDALPGSQRDLLHDHYWKERSWTELAARTGTPPGTLRVRAHRSCQLLRTLLGDAA